MTHPFVKRQVRLHFNTNAAKVRADISAVTFSPQGHLWLGSDELTTIERLSMADNDEYAQHQPFEVGDYVKLQEVGSEIDIEGMDFSAGYLWVVGSHSSKRKKVRGSDFEENLLRLADVDIDPNRYLLARIPIVDGEPVKRDKANKLTAAALQKGARRSVLTDALEEDEHLGMFLKMGVPSKENGFDIEAIAAHNNRIFLGLRGPVLSGMAIILELEIEEKKSGAIKLKKLKNNRLYRKHFVDLNGLGVRDLCFQGEDLIILAGPTMSLRSTMQIFRWRNALAHATDTVLTLSSTEKSDPPLSKLFDLTLMPKGDNAEGIALLPNAGDAAELMVVYDSPRDERLSGDCAILADIFQLPG